MNIKGLELAAAPLLLNIDKKNVREAARNLARAVDKSLDEKYGKQRSERLQGEQIQIITAFVEEYSKTLKEDWDVRQAKLAKKPPVPVSTPAKKPKKKKKEKKKKK